MAETRTVIIVGSSRSDGDTMLIASELSNMFKWDVVDLQNFSISEFDYKHRNQSDDFIPLITRIIENYDVIIFATPVYWYSMSGRLKIFFDRISDLLKIRKELGRKLRAKSMAALSCSASDDQGAYFWKPFEKTAEYLGMDYLGDVHVIVVDHKISTVSDHNLASFGKLVKK